MSTNYFGIISHSEFFFFFLRSKIVFIYNVIMYTENSNAFNITIRTNKRNKPVHKIQVQCTKIIVLLTHCVKKTFVLKIIFF